MLAGAGLVCVSTSVGVLYKASQAATGGFQYNPASAVCIAECVKLCMSASFHFLDKTTPTPGVGHQLDPAAARQILILSLLYASNNRLSFYVYMLADPGTIFLFKSASTLIVAAIQCLFAGKSFSSMQWKAMALQACGMVIVQYNPCKGEGLYSPRAYAYMCLSTVITAITAARNEYLVKNYTISLNVQNGVLYGGGVCANLVAFLILPGVGSQKNIGFFEGYENPLAVGVVVANCFVGLAITAVYKYADAVVKCFASDVTAVLLVIISVLFFDLQGSITMACGMFVVVFSVHLYIDATNAAKPAVTNDSGPMKQSLPEKIGAGHGGKGDDAQDSQEEETSNFLKT